MEGEELVSLLSSDGNNFEVSKPVAAMILVPKPCDWSTGIDGGDECVAQASEAVDGADYEFKEEKAAVRVLEVRSSILAKVIEYCNHHAMHGIGEGENCEEDWDQQFINGLDDKTIFSLGMAAELLNISELQKLAERKVTKLYPLLQRWGIGDRDVFDYELVDSTYKSILLKKLAEVEMRDRVSLLRAMSNIRLNQPGPFQEGCDMRRSPLGPNCSQ